MDDRYVCNQNSLSLKHRQAEKRLVFLCGLVGAAALAAAPMQYSQNLCIFFLILFSAAFILFLKYEKLKNYFNFPVVFSITYFFVYFVYPVFIYPYDKYRFFSFAFGFNENVITKATGLALLGYISFMAGLMRDGKKHRRVRFIGSFSPLADKYKSSDTRFVTLLVIIFTVIDIIRVVQSGSERLSGDQGGIWGYFLYIKNCVFAVSVTMQLCCLKKEYAAAVSIFKKNALLWIVIMTDILVCFGTGRRTDPIFLSLLILAGVFLHRRKFSIWKMILIVAAGVFFMNMIRLARMEDAAAFSFSIIDMAQDLILNNYTLYVAYDYVGENGMVPFTLIGSLLRIFPFLLGITVRIFDIPYFHVYSASFFTVLILKENAGSLGLGTNIIASLYLGAGLFGVIAGMYFYGMLVKKCSLKASENNPYKVLLFLILMGVSVYNVRSEYFYAAGLMTVSMVMMYLFRKIRL